MTEKSTAFNHGTEALKQQIAILEQKNQELERTADSTRASMADAPWNEQTESRNEIREYEQEIRENNEKIEELKKQIQEMMNKGGLDKD